MVNQILLGFKVGTGEPVYMRLHHLAIFGLTQLSGKTTTLEALISRSGLKAIAFIVKRGESGFTKYNLVTPYYKPKANWQFVEGLVNVALGEKVKFEPGMRWAIIKVSKGAKDLREVKARAEEMLEKAKRDFQKQLFEKLITYLEIVVPELERWRFSDKLELTEGVNVMDLSEMRTETQHLVIASTIEYAFQNLDHVVVIIPEAWETMPQNKMTPVKWVAQQFIRKGAAIGNYLWLDSFPNYEVLMVRIDNKVHIMTFEELWNTLKTCGDVESNGYEEKLMLMKDVWTLGSTPSGLTWVQIRKLFRHPYEGQILRINTIKGVVDLSPNHPVMKYPRYLVEASTIRKGDRLCMKSWRDRIFSDDGLFIGNQDIAWLYGFFAAEGWVSKNNHVCFSNKSKGLLEKVAEILETEFHHSASLLEPRLGVYTLDVNSPILAEHFKRECYGDGGVYSSETKIVPTNILNAPKKIKEAFLAGYIEGDGSRRRGDIAGFTTTSRRLALGILWLVHSVSEIECSVHIRDDKPKVIQVLFNKTKERKKNPDAVKKLEYLYYNGWLYDIEVETADHTFNVGIGNFRVKNSQDIGSIDKAPLRQCDNWLMGRMKEAHEVERILKQLLGMKVPAEEIQTLPLGHFYAAIGNEVKKTYVLPVGVPEDVGREVALGKRSPESVRDEFLKPKLVEVNDLVWKEKYEQLKKEFDEWKAVFESEVAKCVEEEKRKLEREGIKEYEEKMGTLRQKVEELETQVKKNLEEIGKLKDEKATLEAELKKLEPLKAFGEALRKFLAECSNVRVAGFEPATSTPSEISVAIQQPTLTIQKHTPPLSLDDSSLEGKIAIVYAEGELPKDKWFSVSDVTKAFQRHGWKQDPRTSSALDKFCQWGYFVKQMSGKRPDYRFKLTPEQAREKGLLKEVERK